MTKRERDRQRRDAYTKGTIVRMEKAELKRQLKTMPVYEALYVVADIVKTRGKYEAASPYELIRACRNVGHQRASKICLNAGVDTETKLRSIAPLRRETIAFDIRHLADDRRRTNGHHPDDDETDD
jgi:hypothetical protein